MRWSDEKVELLKELITAGKRYDEISNIIGCDIKSIENKCFRINLKVNFRKESFCKNCHTPFTDLITNNRLFCSKSCSVSYNNKSRRLSTETKNKISNQLKEFNKNSITT
jgi:protein-arginine kinase activator protein McsA